MTIPVSVVMPVYNRQDFVSEAIESILGQTFGDFEFIIVDDCSTDKSLAIAFDYQKQDDRIRIDHQEQNKGVVGARNTGLKLAQGKYIAWMDSDDISMPERIGKQFLFMERHPDIGITSTDAIMIDGKGNSFSTFHRPQSHILITWAFCFDNPIINPTVMANRELCTQAGGYRDLAKDKSEYFPEDYDLWTRLSKKTIFYNFGETLLKYRLHSNNISLTHPQSTLRNSSIICRAYVQSVLGKEIPPTLIDMLWGIANLPSLRGMPQLIEMLYNHFINLPEITPQEKKDIREDASVRLWQMSKKYAFDLYSLPTFMKALKINQGSYIYMYIIKKMISKIKTQS